MCGRLMCCLGYEHGYYEKVKKTLPKIGKRVAARQGEGKVVRQNVLKGNVTVSLDSGEEVEILPSDITKDGPFRKKGKRSDR
jgi:cell fate regulator YaaT (PSP1 superfamily)